MAASVEQPAHHGPQHEEPWDYRNRPHRGDLACGHHEEADGEDVLEDQHANRQTAGERGRLVGLLQRLHGEDRARERQGEPDDGRSLQIELTGQ